MKAELAIAQLAIVDGAWQDAPDNIAYFDAAALFEGNLERGNLYLVVEVEGEPEGRDELARELIETARREYAASRGSIAGSLMQALRAVNEFLYNTNATLPRELRRIAGMTAAVLRSDELFIAQGGPGATCLMRGQVLQRYPAESGWFEADETIVNEWLAARNFGTPGEVPLGMRRNYTPDLFHISLQPGDVMLLATRALVHLLTHEELLDTVAHRHPDEIVASLEDLTGASDLSIIALRLGDARAPAPVAPMETTPTEIEPPVVPLNVQDDELEIGSIPASSATLPPRSNLLPPVELPAPPPASPPVPALEDSDQALQRARQDLAAEHARQRSAAWRVRSEQLRAGILRGTSATMGTLAGLTGRVNWTGMGQAADRAIDGVGRGVLRGIVAAIRLLTPGDPKTEKPTAAPAPRRLQTAWKLAALVVPILLIIAGLTMWFVYRAEQRTAHERKLAQLTTTITQEMENAKRLAPTDRAGARTAAQNAVTSAEQLRALTPNDARASQLYYQARDLLDTLNGVAVLNAAPLLITFADPKTKATRVIVRTPDLFILDRGAQRVYRYQLNDLGAGATPTPADGVILKPGDRIEKRYDDRAETRTVGELFDLFWVDAGRLVALDRTGVFYQYDPGRGTWVWRAVSDPAAWARATMGVTYANNLYLLDASRPQILRYVTAAADIAAWSAATTYFAPGVPPPDLTTVIDAAIDGDVWLLRDNGSLLRYNQGKPNELVLSGIEVPITKPSALFTSEKVSNLYIADAGNQRLVQIDKTTGKFARQFKPSAQDRDVFKALQTFTVDEPNKRFFFVNDNKVYAATIPPAQ